MAVGNPLRSCRAQSIFRVKEARQIEEGSFAPFPHMEAVLAIFLLKKCPNKGLLRKEGFTLASDVRGWFITVGMP